MTQATTIAPVLKSVHVKCDPAHAFAVFTREIGSWWPLETHALHPGTSRGVVWEERAGGEVYEISADGARSHWATVLDWSPPTGFTIAWHVNPEAAAPTEIEVRFSSEAGGTRVDLEHRYWERLGSTGATTREGYGSKDGWEAVLARFSVAVG